MLLLHGAAILSTAFDKRSISGKNYSKVGIILEVNNEPVVET